MIFKRMNTLFYPERFQGWGKSRRYFEGWYFKLVNASRDLAFAFIPGVSFDRMGKGHAFVQVFNGFQNKAEYHQFPIGDFSGSPHKFEVCIGENQFSSHRMDLNLPGIRGRIQFRSLTPWPDKWFAPGIMGPYTFVPFMECRHGIVSMDHDLEGQLLVGNTTLNFDGGKGYIEKDWGRSFPSAYVWMQTNHFSTPGTSLKLSVAKIPWLGSWFIGFIGGLWHNGIMHPFTSYNGSRLMKCGITDEDVSVELENSKCHLTIYSKRENATPLAAPKLGDMSGHIKESLSAVVHVRLFSKIQKKVLFDDEGHVAGFEVAGSIQDLLKS